MNARGSHDKTSVHCSPLPPDLLSRERLTELRSSAEWEEVAPPPGEEEWERGREKMRRPMRRRRRRASMRSKDMTMVEEDDADADRPLERRPGFAVVDRSPDMI